MLEISSEYWNTLATQTLTISSLLGGFSIAIIANLVVSNLNTRLSKYIMIASTLAACFFLITVFGMTAIVLQTTDGYPVKVIASDFRFDRLLGMSTFFLGIISLLVMISLSGWTKSKGMGIFTTFAGIITLIFTLILMS